jgi:hypothetical protein
MAGMIPIPPESAKLPSQSLEFLGLAGWREADKGIFTQ